jgi:hypothetical protein
MMKRDSAELGNKKWAGNKKLDNKTQAKNQICPLHGKDCPGDSGDMFMDMNHPDDMFGVHIMREKQRD